MTSFLVSLLGTSSLSTLSVALLSTLTFAYGFLWAILYFTHDGDEPPLVLTTIPFISPILGMLKWKTRFYNRIRYTNPAARIL